MDSQVDHHQRDPNLVLISCAHVQNHVAVGSAPMDGSKGFDVVDVAVNGISGTHVSPIFLCVLFGQKSSRWKSQNVKSLKRLEFRIGFGKVNGMSVSSGLLCFTVPSSHGS